MRIAAALAAGLLSGVLLLAGCGEGSPAVQEASAPPTVSETVAEPAQVPGDKAKPGKKAKARTGGGNALQAGKQPKERHVPADMALARRAVAQPSDLVLPWHHLQVPQGRGRPCPGVDPDLSRLTITGRANSTLVDEDGLAAIYSNVRVFANEGQAAAYFEAHYKDALMKCFEADSLELFKRTGASQVELSSARMGSEPPVGNDTRIIELEYELTTDQGQIFVRTQLVAFRKGRAIGQNKYVNLADGQLVVAQRVVSRLDAG